ncbi:MAG TPA: hypothetical protein DCF62_08865 [Porticoccaceae bacterium]|nr:hypothetical protein [Porticoccaceae bacterium]HCO61431.1 hypothetical protein [Porticoccaceae bacterium]
MAKSVFRVSESEAEKLVKLARRYTGVALDSGRLDFIQARLLPVLNACSLECFADLIRLLEVGESDSIKNAFIDAITTHETYFYREPSAFTLLKNTIIPRYVRDGRGPVLRICSAACSTGQEVYSICMVLDELSGMLDQVRIRIDGYDISDACISTARHGSYTAYEVNRGLSLVDVSKYFEKIGSRYVIVERFRRMAKFKTLNLLGELGAMPAYDIIFCRNIMNYFESGDRVRLFRNLASVTVQGGVMIAGGAEILPKEIKEFESHHGDGCVYYQRV